MKTAAILGADSMLGRALAGLLRDAGVPTVLIGRSSHNDLVVDITDHSGGCISSGYSAEVVFHCIAEFSGDDSAGLSRNLSVNTFGCRRVLEVLEGLGSTICVYAGSIFSDKTCDSAGYSSYGLSKALGEQILEWGMVNRGGIFSSLRFSQLYDSEGRCCKHQPWFGRVVA